MADTVIDMLDEVFRGITCDQKRRDAYELLNELIDWLESNSEYVEADS